MRSPRPAPRGAVVLNSWTPGIPVHRIAIGLIPWGEHTLVVLEWHPLRGPGTRMHGLPVDYVVAVRNGMMLTKLARIAARERDREGGSGPP